MTAQLSLDDAISARDHALATVEAAADDQDRNVIDAAIRHVAAQGRPFSANDVRPLLPAVKGSLIGSRFRTLHGRKVIQPTGRYVPSTDPGTHAHPIAEWVRADG